MAEYDDRQRVRVRRLATDGERSASAQTEGVHGAVGKRTLAEGWGVGPVAHPGLAYGVGKRTLSESWGIEQPATDASASVFFAAADSAWGRLAELRIANAAHRDVEAFEAAQQLRLSLEIVRRAANERQGGMVTELEAAAAPILAAVAPRRDAIAEIGIAHVQEQAVQLVAVETAKTAPAHAVAVANRGVRGARDPLPFLDLIQRAFGRHDITRIRARIGGPAAIAAKALGARAYATGDAVAFTDSPDLHTAAHEAAHVVQQRAGVVSSGLGAANDAHERDADEVAERVVAGRSAEALLDRVAPGAPSTAAEGVAVQRRETTAPADAPKSDVAFAYLRANLAAFTAAWTVRLAVLALPAHPRITWAPFGIVTAFADALAGALGADPLFLRLPELMYPSSPWYVIDLNRELTSGTPGVSWGGHDPTGPLTWNPAAGEALAIELVARVAESITQMVPRYVVQLDAKHPVPITAADLVTSQPMDRVTARLLCDARVLTPVPLERGTRPARSGAPTAFRDGVRFLRDYRWLGESDAKLWNWIEVTDPRDATAEEVAATLWLDTEQSQRAYIITSATPFFRIEPSHARVLLGDRAPAPHGLDDPHADNALVLAGSAYGTDAAVAQAASERKLDRRGVPIPPDLKRLGSQLELSDRQLERTRDLLAPWQLFELVLPASQWVASYREHLLSVPTSRLLALAPVIDAQQMILFEATGAIEELVDASKGLAGVDGAEGPVTRVLRHYAIASGESHLCESARAELALGRKAKGGLSLALLDGALHASFESSQDLVANETMLKFGGDESRADYATEQGQLIELHARYADGAAIDNGDVALLAANLKQHAFEAKARTLYLQLHNLSESVRESTSGAVETLSSAFGGDIRTLPGQLQKLLDNLEAEVIRPLSEKKKTLIKDLGPNPEKAQLAFVTTKVTAEAELNYTGFLNESALDVVIPRAIKLMSEQYQTTAILNIVIQIAVLIGVSVLGGLAGDLVASVVRGTLLTDAATATIGMLRVARAVDVGSTVVGIAADASVNTLGQMAMSGGNFADGFFENFATNATLRVALAPLHSVAEAWGSAGSEIENASLWERTLGRTKLVLREGAVLTAEMITGAGVDYVVKRTLGNGPPADESTALDWAVQGASMAAGKYFGHKLAAFQKDLVQLAEHGIYLRRRAAKLQVVADHVTRTGDRDVALELFAQHHELLLEERKTLDELTANPKVTLSPQAIETLRAGNRAELEGVRGRAYAALPLRFAGLSPDDASGKVWAGATEDIAIALHQADRCGMRVELVNHDQAARTWQVRFNDEEITILENDLRGRPRQSKREITDADRLHARRYAEAAEFMQAAWEAKTKHDIDKLSPPQFDLIQIGGAQAGVLNQATLPATGDGLGAKLNIYDHVGTLSKRGAQELGQPPEKWDAPGMRASEQAAKDDKWLKSDALDRTLAIGRLEVQTPAYRGRVVDRIQRRPEVADSVAREEKWLQPDRAFRIKVVGEDKTQYFYAARIDYAGGPGASDLRQVKGVTEPNELESMLADGRVLRAEDPAYAARVRGGETLVWGGTANGAWAAEAARNQSGATVTVMGDARPARTDWPQLVEDYEAVMSDLAASDASSPPPALTRRKQELEAQIANAHGGMAIARNRKPGAAYEHGIHGDPTHGLHIDFGTPSKITPTAGGRVLVTIGQGPDAATKMYDQVVIAVGLDPTTPGGPGALLGPGAPVVDRQAKTLGEVPTGTIALRPVFAPSGTPATADLLYLESVDPPGIRLEGAAYATKRMMPWIEKTARDEFGSAIDRMEKEHAATRDYGQVSSDSTKVTTGIEAQRDRIPRGNEVLAAQAYRLPGKDHTLELDKTDPSKWDDQVREFFTLELRANGEWVRVKRLDGGKSGAVLYQVSVGDNDVGVFKIFRSVRDAQVEAEMLEKLKAAHLTKMKPVRERGVVGVANGNAAGALLMDTAKGESVAKMIKNLPSEPGERTPKFEQVEAAVGQVAEALAELHARSETSHGGRLEMMTREAKLSDANYMLDKNFRGGADVAKVRAALGDRDFERVKAQLEGPVLQALLDAEVPATCYHGDANAGNFILSGARPDGEFAEVDVIDVGTMKYSIDDATHVGTRTGAADVARFLASLETLQPGALSDAEVATLRKMFNLRYAAQYRGLADHGVDNSQYQKAEAWYRAELQIAAVKDNIAVKGGLMTTLRLEAAR